MQQADAALTKVIQRGLFVLEERSEFDFLTHGSSAQELLAFWDKTGADDNNAEEDPAKQHVQEVYDHAEEIRQAAGQEAEITLHERARILQRKPNAKNEEMI